MFGLTRAPDFPNSGLTWINTAHPLSLQDLRGKIVILDFWTFCCINCMHVLPTLARIEKAFSDSVQVIGVHSPKFEAERDPANVAAAVARYGIEHPVVHDPEMRIWQSYAVRAWPTLTLVSPDGYVIGQVSGEPDPERLEMGLRTMLADFATRGEVRETAAITVRNALVRKQAVPDPKTFSFPGKIKPLVSPPADHPTARWVVADSGHHQVVLLDDQGAVCQRYGSGEAGWKDGQADAARFRDPQGVCADASGLWIADTGNHRLRRLDFETQLVNTVAGSGARGGALQTDHEDGNSWVLDLASPWDVTAALDQLGQTETLYLANAGTHQLAILDADPQRPLNLNLRQAVGTSGENLVDGTAETCLLAQPSGLALERETGTLWFVDSETSAVRSMDLTAPYRVQTVVGEGLFDFGHLDGAFDRALFQHPLGLTCLGDSGDLVVADSYNAVVRRVHVRGRRVSTLPLGTCQDPVCYPLGEPAGVSADGENRLLISDTNNHRIVEVRLDLGTYRTWAI